MNQDEIVFILAQCTQCKWERSASTAMAIAHVQTCIKNHGSAWSHEIEVRAMYRVTAKR